MADRRRSFPTKGSRFARSLRVNQVLREVLAQEIERLADADERLRLLTITSVSCTPDLRTATVFLSTLPDDALIALEERRNQLQAKISAEMRLKRTPRLGFEADPAVSAGLAVDEALRRIRTREGQGDRGDHGIGDRP
ncbi:MAG: ribosome-binding factor A [Acidimicrobiales bacterium]